MELTEHLSPLDFIDLIALGADDPPGLGGGSFKRSVRMKNRCFEAVATTFFGERPFPVADQDRVAGVEVGVGVAKDRVVVPSAVVVLGATTNGARGAAAGLRESAH